MVKVDSLGQYRIALTQGADFYKCSIAAKKCFSLVNTITLDKGIDSFEYNVPLTEIDFEKAYEIVDITFETNKAILTSSSYPALDKLVETLKINEIYILEISGHTDNVGSNEYNQKLSEKRAQAVVKYLVAAGIPENRFIAFGYGEERPKADNATAEGKSQNRRVEMKFSENRSLSELAEMQNEMTKLETKIEMIKKTMEEKQAKINKDKKEIEKEDIIKEKKKKEEFEL